MTVVNPSQSSPGDTIEAADINGPVNQLAAVINGGIDATNLAASAVSTAGIADGAVTGSKLATSAITLGYAQIVTSFTTTTTSADVPVTGLSVTVTVPSGSRNLKITGFASMKSSAAAGTVLTWVAREGSTTLGTLLWTLPVTGYNSLAYVVAYVPAPSSGSHTYFIACGQSAAGTITVNAGAANPAWGNPGPAYVLVEAI